MGTEKNGLPLLSVVVAAYNVEQYIASVLESIVTQSYSNIEVVVVNDGSTDMTPNVVSDFQRLHKNVRLVNQENAGLSAARNHGIEEAGGAYLAFVDGDDLVPEGAYEVMMSTIISTGSDMISGFVERLNETNGKRFDSPHFKKAIQGNYLKTNIRQHTELVYDSTAWNKIYRLDFMKENQLKYPVGRLYEDIPVEMLAHLNAKTVDVIDDLVYTWRIRSTGSPSITQDRLAWPGLNDRLDMLKLARNRILAANDHDSVLAAFDFKMLDQDLFVHIEALENRTAEFMLPYYKKFVDFLREVNISAVIDKLPVSKQLVYRLFFGAYFDELSMFLNKNQKVKFAVADGSAVISNRYLPDEILSAMVVNLSDKTKTKVEKVKFDEATGNYQVDGLLNISGIHLSNLAVDSLNVRVTNFGHDVFKDEPATFSLEKDTLRFSTKLDIVETLDVLGVGQWRLDLIGVIGGANFQSPIANPIKNGRKKVAQGFFDKHNQPTKVVQRYDRNWRLILDFMPEINHVRSNLAEQMITFAGARLKNGGYEMVITLSRDDSDDVFAMLDQTVLNLSNVIDNVYHISLPGEMVNDGKIHHLSFKSGKIVDRSLNVNEFYAQNFAGLSVGLNGSEIVLMYNEESVLLTDMTPSGNEVVFSFNKIVSGVALESETGLFRKLDADVKDNFISTKLAINKDTATVNVGESWRMLVEVNQKWVPVRYDFGRPKTMLRLKNYLLRIQGDEMGMVQFVPESPWTNKLESHETVRKVLTRVAYSFMRLLPIKKNLWVFDAYWASQYASNERAMYEYLENKHPEMKSVWALKDTSLEIPGSGSKVREKSFAYYMTLARAKYLVQNANFPQEYIKRPGQIEVETLHGTFMKTMGFDEPHFAAGSRETKRRFAQRNSRWDYIVSPSKFMDFSPFVFRSRARVIHSGFPRNDRLINDNNVETISSLKRRFNVPLENEVVLYAPTFRQQGGFDFRFDIEQFLKRLGDRQTLVVRLHYFVAKEIDFSKYAGRVINASQYDNIEDLYLMSDVLVTDYSSVMFDYAVTNKPMIFFAYDLEWYLNPSNRGTYLDYENVVPGPIVEDSTELIDKLSNLESLRLTYADKMTAFRDRFVTYGREGDAAENVVETVLKNKVLSYSAAKKHHFILGMLMDVLRVKHPYSALAKRLKRIVNASDEYVVFSISGNRLLTDTMHQLAEDARLNGKKVVWITSENHKETLVKQGWKVYLDTSIRAIYWRLRAGEAVFYGIQDDNWVKNKKQTWVQVWDELPKHRLGLEQGMLDLLIEEDVTQKAMLKQMHMADYFVVGTDANTERFASAFQLREAQILPMVSYATADNAVNKHAAGERLSVLLDFVNDISMKVGDYFDGFYFNPIDYADRVNFVLKDSHLAEQFGWLDYENVQVSSDKPLQEIISTVDVVLTGSGPLAGIAQKMGTKVVVMDNQRTRAKVDRLVLDKNLMYAREFNELNEIFDRLIEEEWLINRTNQVLTGSLTKYLVEPAKREVITVDSNATELDLPYGTVMYGAPYGLGKTKIVTSHLKEGTYKSNRIVVVRDANIGHDVSPYQHEITTNDGIVGFVYSSN